MRLFHGGTRANTSPFITGKAPINQMGNAATLRRGGGVAQVGCGKEGEDLSKCIFAILKLRILETLKL